ncbi:hypothetical protein FACS189413_13910 [Bacteroidia bacterium]|nr:hypothetical protein FACS189413_13910 [Bacteroidia bacterium]
MKNVFKKHLIWVIGIGIVVTFFLPILDIPLPYFKEKLNLPPEKMTWQNWTEFYTVWIALFGVVGGCCTIWQAQKQTRENRFINSFAQAVKLLESNSESTRLGGIYNLRFLAKEYPEDYKEKVFKILCGHVCSKTAKDECEEKYKDGPSNEIQMLLNLLFRENEGLFKELEEAYLPKCYLPNSHLHNAYLKNAKFFGAKLEGANFQEANLEGAGFKDANLKGAMFFEAHLEGADLRADLGGANLEGAIYNKETRFPEGFKPEEHGMKKTKKIRNRWHRARVIYKLKKRKLRRILNEY